MGGAGSFGLGAVCAETLATDPGGVARPPEVTRPVGRLRPPRYRPASGRPGPPPCGRRVVSTSSFWTAHSSWRQSAPTPERAVAWTAWPEPAWAMPSRDDRGVGSRPGQARTVIAALAP